MGPQGIQHSNPLVVTQSAKLLLRLYQKTLSSWTSDEALASTDQTLELVYQHVTAFLSQRASSADVRGSQDMVMCACALA